MLGAMREREFWQLLEEVFGRSYGRALAHDQGLTKLHGMTVVEALAAGEEPRVVWNVLCGQMDVPDAKRWGRITMHRRCPSIFTRGAWVVWRGVLRMWRTSRQMGVFEQMFA